MPYQQTLSLLRECIPLFTVLADENRHLIFKLLLENGKMNVNDITENLHLSRPAVSHHLKIMLHAEMVSVEQVGKERFYAVSTANHIPKLKRLVALMEQHCPNNRPL